MRKIVLNCQDRILAAIWEAFPKDLKARGLENFIRFCLLRGCADGVLCQIPDTDKRLELRALFLAEGFPLPQPQSSQSEPARPEVKPQPRQDAEPQPEPARPEQAEAGVEAKKTAAPAPQAADNRPKAKKEVHFDWMDEMYAKLERMMAGE